MKIDSLYKADPSSAFGDEYGNAVFKCVYVSPKSDGKYALAVLRIHSLEDGCDYLYLDRTLPFEHWKYFVEHIEPRKEYFNAYIPRYENRIKYQGPWDTVEDANVGIKAFSDECYYGRLIMTHHSETHVNVEFHLKRK